MRRFAFITLFTLLLVTCTGVAVAAAEPGVLSDAEYVQLVTIQNQISDKSLKSLSSLERAQRNCVQLHAVSSLVGAERADCRNAFTWLEVSVRIVAKLKTCEHRTTTNARLGCLLPDYQHLAAAVRGVYNAEAYVTKLAVERQLSNDCVKAVGESQKALAAESRMVTDAARLASAIRSRDLISVQKYGGLYDADTADVEQAGSDSPMTVCPHS